MYLQRVNVRSYEKGLVFTDREFTKLLDQGHHWCFDPRGKTEVDVVSMRDPWLVHKDLDLIISSGQLTEEARIIELSDSQRALVWVEDRFARILAPGRYVLWLGFKDTRIEIVDASQVKFSHGQMAAILDSESGARELIVHQIAEGMAAVVFIDGAMTEVVASGCHVFWRRMGQVRVVPIDIRECTLDVGGQDIISLDKVSLRLNGLVTYKVVDPAVAVTEVENYQQSLYRETQLALRAVVGTRDLDTLLEDKDSLALKVRDLLVSRGAVFGLKIIGFGIRDVILPGEMKELLNRVVESKKAAEANLISRREETAAMRSQANTARILAGNPTLMRLRELELLEKVAASSNLNIVCGEGALSDNLIKLV